MYKYTIIRELPEEIKTTEDYDNVIERELDAIITCSCGNEMHVYQPYAYYQCGCGNIFYAKIVVDLIEEA